MFYKDKSFDNYYGYNTQFHNTGINQNLNRDEENNGIF